MKSTHMVLLLLTLVSVAIQEEVITAQGRIRGETREGYISYRGIPYASINESSARYKVTKKVTCKVKLLIEIL
jgi:hypothetical protein